MMLAIKKFHNNCVSMLMDEFGQKAVNSINESGITAAHMAAATGTAIRFSHCKNIFMCGKSTKIIFTNIIINPKFF